MFLDAPIVYGRSTCGNKFVEIESKLSQNIYLIFNSNQDTCDKSSNPTYVFVSNSIAVAVDQPYLCKNHPK